MFMKRAAISKVIMGMKYNGWLSRYFQSLERGAAAGNVNCAEKLNMLELAIKTDKNDRYMVKRESLEFIVPLLYLWHTGEVITLTCAQLLCESVADELDVPTADEATYLFEGLVKCE